MNTSFPRIHYIYNRYKKATPTKPAAIEMMITYNYQQKYISTGIMLYPNQWKNGKITNCPDILQISQSLNQMLVEVRQVIIEMSQEGNIFIQDIPRRIAMKKQKVITFLEFCKQRASIRKYNKKQDTQERYDRFLKHFTAWGKIKYFEDIKEETIILYDEYLKSTGMKPYSKWNNYHRFLSGFIKDAIDEGLIYKNPYKWVNIEKDKDSKGLDKCLTPEEFRRLKVAKMPSISLERVRDVFVFQTYTCLRYSDLVLFDARLVQEINGMKMYIKKAKKTNRQFTAPILSPAWDILMKYEGKLPIISNVKYNLYLKNVALAADIDKPLSTHWARHTGATILLNEGVDMKIVTKICGHSSTRITEQVYAKLLDETVVATIKNLKI